MTSRLGPATVLLVAACISFGVGNMAWAFLTWDPVDVQVYWDAAMRLRSGEALYPSAAVPAETAYRYAPWFAILWIPLTYLPRDVVDVGWSALLLGSAALVIGSLLRQHTPSSLALAFLVGSFLVMAARFGNVQPLMVAGLALSAGKSWSPIAIGISASLKATPILFVLVFVGRRQWGRAVVAIAVAASLIVPMIFLGIGEYPTAAGWSYSLYSVSVPLFVVVAVAAVVAAGWVAWRHPRYAWLAASVAVILTLPRYFPYEVTYLLVGSLASSTQGGQEDGDGIRA